MSIQVRVEMIEERGDISIEHNCPKCHSKTQQVATYEATGEPVWECRECYTKTRRFLRKLDPPVEALWADQTSIELD